MATIRDYHERIVLDPEVRFGKPVVRGTRITVGDVLGYLAGGMTEDEVLQSATHGLSHRRQMDRRAAMAMVR